MNHLNQRGTTRRAMLRAGAAARTAAALGAVGLFAAGTTSAATTIARQMMGRPYPPDVTDTSHCAPDVADTLRGFFTAKSQHDVPTVMSYFSRANTVYIDACLGIASLIRCASSATREAPPSNS
jgi:hypothetical protein